MLFYIRHYFLKTFLFLLLGYLLGACASGCFEGDDFGGKLTASVDSHRPQGSTDFKDSSMNGDGEIDPTNHVIRWQYTRYITDGKPIVFTIKGGWCPFFKCTEDENYDVAEFEKIQVDSATDFNQSCPAPPNFQKNFIDGAGLYMLLRDPISEAEPNETIEIMRNPRSANIHVYAGVNGTGESAKYSSDNALPKDSFGNEVVLAKGLEVYFKILDSHYYDNTGSYEIKFFSGVQDPNRIYPYETLRKTIEHFFTSSAVAMFTNLVDTEYYRQLILFALSFQLFFIAGAFLFGITNVSFGELAIKMFKFIMVAALISPEAWTFFNNILFGALIDVPKQLIGLAASGDYDPDGPFKFLDEIVWYKFFSSVVWEVKLNALFISSDIRGAVWIVCFILLAVLFLFFATSAVFRYMMCIIAISFLIAVFPIIFIGALFSQLKSSFDSWIKQSLSYVLQGFMSFIIVIFFADLVLDEMYRTLGFKACKTNIFLIGFNIFGNPDKGEEDTSIFALGIPGFVPGNPKKFQPIRLTDLFRSVPNQRYNFDETLEIIKIPPKYEDEDFRYTELPFLDPNINSKTPEDPKDWEEDVTVTSQKDHKRIVEMMRNGNLVNLHEMMVLLLTILILISLKDAILAVAQFIAVGGMSWSPTVGGLFDGAYTNLSRTLAQSNFKALKAVGGVMMLPDVARAKIGTFIDKVDNATSAPINSIPLAGSILSGSNLSTREIANRMVQDSHNFKALHLYQDVVGGNVEWANAKFRGAAKSAIVAGMLEPVTSVSSLAKTARMIERYGSGEKDSKGVLKSIAKGIGSSVDDRAKIKEERAEHMDRALALYYLKSDEKIMQEAVNRKFGGKNKPDGGDPNSTNPPIGEQSPRSNPNAGANMPSESKPTSSTDNISDKNSLGEVQEKNSSSVSNPIGEDGRANAEDTRSFVMNFSENPNNPSSGLASSPQSSAQGDSHKLHDAANLASNNSEKNLASESVEKNNFPRGDSEDPKKYDSSLGDAYIAGSTYASSVAKSDKTNKAEGGSDAGKKPSPSSHFEDDQSITHDSKTVKLTQEEKEASYDGDKHRKSIEKQIATLNKQINDSSDPDEKSKKQTMIEDLQKKLND